MRLNDRLGILYIIGRTIPFFLFLQILLCGALFSANDIVGGNHHLTSWNTDNGLPQSSVNSIVQTRNGYIWFSTYDGLVRFDGIKFTVFNSTNFPLLKSNRVLDIFESKDGSLWCSTEGGGIVVKRNGGPDAAYSSVGGIRLEFAKDFFEDSEGRIWVCSREGLHFFKDGKWFPFSAFTTEIADPDGMGNRIFEDSRGEFWVANAGGNMYRFHNGGISHIKPPPLKKNRTVIQNVNFIYEDKKQNVWFSYSNVLSCFNGKTFTHIPFEIGHFPVAMAEDHNGNLWALNYNEELLLVQDGNLIPVNIPGMKDKKRVTTFIIDREGLFWFGTTTDGLIRLRTVPLVSYKIKKGLSTSSLHQDSRGTLWVSTNAYGPFLFENEQFVPFGQDLNGAGAAILTDSSGNHWCGKWATGLFRVKGDQIKQFFSIEDGLMDSTIMSLYEDNEKNIWIGTGSGLSVYRDGKIESFHDEQRFKEDYVISIIKDKRGVLWFGTKGSGLYRFEDGRFTNYSTSDGLAHNSVRALYEDHTGSLWVGTYGGGLNRFKNGKFVTISTEQGLYNNVVSCILEDHLGFFWMSCNLGVYRVSKQELHDVADGKIQSVNCTYYNKADGMETAECNGGYQPSGWKSTDGKLWFPTIQGIVMFDPYKADINKKPPPVIVEKLLVDGKEKELHTKLELSPGVNRLEFHFTGLSFTVPERVRFRFKMEGLEEEWQEVGTRRVAYYSRIPPGNYTFRVTACNNDGIWNETGAEVPFSQKPFFYQTSWFLALCIIAVILLILTLYRMRVRQLKSRERELNRIVASRTLELAEKSEKLKEMDRIKSRFFANISHEFRTPLTLIMGPMEQLLSVKREKKEAEAISLALKNSQRLLALINQLLELSKLDSGKMKLQAGQQNIVPFLEGVVGAFESLAVEKGLELSFHRTVKEIVLYFDQEKMEKVMINLLANAIKFTPPGGKVAVTVGINGHGGRGHLVKTNSLLEKGCLEIVVRDTGIGIPEEEVGHIFDRFYQSGATGSKEHKPKGTGIGLDLVKQLVELHRGDIYAKSVLGIGTEFFVLLPLGSDHLKKKEILDIDMPIPQRESYKTVVHEVMKQEHRDEGIEEIEDSTEAEDSIKEKEVILVVEDNADVRRYIRGPLEEHYTVNEAVDGKDGIEKAKKIIPDLIVSDIMMPNVDGYELCHTLKNNVATSHIPIILLTAKASEKSVLEGLDTGADDYITKPFSTKILLSRIRNLIQLRRQLQKKIQNDMLLQPAEISVSSLDNEFIKNIQSLIEENLSDSEFNVAQLAKKLYMSQSSLYRKIQALSGQTPTLFIRSYRLKRAAQLLSANFGNVTEVAFEVGFSNTSYFTKCFKEMFHHLPSHFQASGSE